MDKIIVKAFNGEQTQEFYYENIEEAVQMYKVLEQEKSIKACEIAIITKTVLKAFNR